MRINHRVVIDIETGAVLERLAREYSGPIALAKGPKPVQVNPAQASGAYAGASRAAADASATGAKYGSQADLLFKQQFDPVTGQLVGFMDPNTLSVDRPSGSYKVSYNRALDQNAENVKRSRGSVSRMMAERGLTGSGLEAKLATLGELEGARQKGEIFDEYTQKSYEDALGKFWGAHGLAADAQAQRIQANMQGKQTAAQTYANLYGTAGQGMMKPASGIGSIIGSGISGAATIGAAAICPWAEGLVRMHDGKLKKARDLKKGDLVRSLDGLPDEVAKDVEVVTGPGLEIKSYSGTWTRCSYTHTFMRARGGYSIANSCDDDTILLQGAGEPGAHASVIDSVTPCGTIDIAPIFLTRAHCYCVDGFWSLE